MSDQPEDTRLYLYVPHEWDLRICPVCGAIVPTSWQAQHAQWHEEAR